MTTITLKINERTKAGKTLLSMLNFFATEKDGIEVIETDLIKSKTDSDNNYNPQFVNWC